MNKIGVFVGEGGNWTFFREIYQYLGQHYQTEAYRQKRYDLPLLHGRLNRWAFDNGIRSLLQRSDLAFFEWASELLAPASTMPRRCPIVARLHSFELYAWAPRIHWDAVDKVILVSQAMQRRFAELYPDHAHKTEVVYNAKPLDTFAPAATGKPFNLDLGMLGSIHPRKRVYEVVLMLHDLRRRGYNAHLHIGGEPIHGPDLDEYYVATQDLVRKLDLSDHVTFYGRVAEPARWLQGIDIFISNSYWEGHQVALVEAMAAGCYCLAHFWGGADELLPAGNLYGSEAELLDKIVAHSDADAAEKRRRQDEMRAIACDKFDQAQQWAAIHRIVEAALEGRP